MQVFQSKRAVSAKPPSRANDFMETDLSAQPIIVLPFDEVPDSEEEQMDEIKRCKQWLSGQSARLPQNAHWFETHGGQFFYSDQPRLAHSEVALSIFARKSRVLARSLHVKQWIRNLGRTFHHTFRFLTHPELLHRQKATDDPEGVDYLRFSVFICQFLHFYAILKSINSIF